MQYPLTLLAPARDKEVAIAAIQAGADAIYIGAPSFGARQAAGNSLESLSEVVRYAHTYGVQALCTLNTLLRDDELEAACRMAHDLYRIGVDALIIQDLKLLSQPLPPIRLHASTQLDNRTPEQVVRLQQLGFRRVVLARELSLDEIRTIHQAVLDYSHEKGTQPIELEAFIHGALCVSYSGRCYLSEVLSQRSANRGCCAQYCRMQYDLLDADGHEIADNDGQPIHQRYLLSLQDMNRSMHIRELVEAGVSTFKIEGRLKDSDYVTNVTALYRMLIDGLFPHDKKEFYQYGFMPDLRKTFHRGGINYLLHGRTSKMANWSTPKSTGEHIGTVLSSNGNRLIVNLIQGVTLHNGDGLCVGDEGFAVNGIESVGGSTTIRINKQVHPAPGTPVYRNLDTEFQKCLSASRKIGVEMVFSETEDGFRLQIGDTGRSFAYAKEAAKQPERALDTIRQQLQKLGDTPLYCRSLTLQTEAYFIPASVLNQWRRETVEQWIADRLIATKPADCVIPDNADRQQLLHEMQATQHRTPEGEHMMTCRYCLLHELGRCRKQHPVQPEPRYLRLRNGKTLALQFDCRQCQMTIDLA